MTTTIKQETGLIKVRQYIIDSEGHKVAAIIDIEELGRLGEVLKIFHHQRYGSIKIAKPLKMSKKV